MFHLSLRTDNAAFAEADGEPTEAAEERKVARILRWLADEVENSARSGPLYDANGNTVGSFHFDEA